MYSESKDTTKPTVAHLRTPYLSYSETFIYGVLKNTRRFRPIVLAMRQENEDIFPFRDVFLQKTPHLFQVLWERVFRFESSVCKYAPWYPAHMQTIRRQQVDVLHAHFGTTGYFAWPLKRFHNLPLVTSFYGADVSRVPLQRRWPLRYNRLFSSGEQFTVVSELMKRQVADLGCPPKKITVVHTGIDLEDFVYYPRNIPSPAEPVKFLIVARFIEKKGVEYAIRAFARVHATYPDTELRIIGDGPLRPQLEALIEKLEVTSAIKLLGFQPHTVFREETERCHILLQPSITASDGDQEGAPVTLMEAQAAGMPVVATLHAAIPEEVLDNVSGFLVPEKDDEALAAKMKILVEHPEIWNKMGQKGRRHIELHYNVQTETQKLENVYERAMFNDRSRELSNASSRSFMG